MSEFDFEALGSKFNENLSVANLQALADDTFRDPEQSYSVDMELGQMTNYQVALPFFMFGKKIGAVTAVQVSTLEGPNRSDWGFKPDCFDALTNWVATAQRLLEYAEIRRG